MAPSHIVPTGSSELATQMKSGAPADPSRDVRIGDADRAAAAERLSAHAAAGRLSIYELEQRVGQVNAAVVAGDLLPLEADLPAPHPVAEPRRPLLVAIATGCLIVAALATFAVGHPIAPPLIAAVLILRARLRRGRGHISHPLIEQRSPVT